MMTRSEAARAAIIALGLGLGGCATIERGVQDEISVVTVPPGARVYAASSSGQTICTSPCSVSGSRKDDISITVTKRGFTPQSVQAKSKVTPALAAASRNEFTPDYLQRVIDVQDGAYRKHEPDAFVITLVPSPVP